MEELGKEILTKTQKAKDRFDELTSLISKPEIIADNKEWKKLVKERSRLEDISNAHDELEKLVSEHETCEKEYASEKDAELRDMFYEEIGQLRKKIEEKVEEVKFLLLPKDENDDNNAIIEIRSAAGGEESALFCSVLLRM